MSEEQVRILKMIEEHKISTEDGAKLLNALTAAHAAREQAAAAAETARSRRSGGDWMWGGPVPPMPPMPPSVPGPGFDPFAVDDDFPREAGRAAREAGRAARELARAATRQVRVALQESRLRDTGPLDAGDYDPTRRLVIRVTDAGNSRPTVNLQLPLGLVNFGLKVAARYIPDDAGIRVQDIREAIQRGSVGPILDVQDRSDDEPGARVEISVE